MARYCTGDESVQPPIRRAAIAVGAVTGLALGILVSVTTDIPLAPEAGLIIGALAGWLSHRTAHSLDSDRD